jgi:cellobiose phosphorylase
MGLILRCLLGLCAERGRLVIDPVIPASLDGLQATLELDGHAIEVAYRIRSAGCGPVAVTLNGVALNFARGASPYRTGAAEIPIETFRAGLIADANRLEIEMA